LLDIVDGRVVAPLRRQLDNYATQLPAIERTLTLCGRGWWQRSSVVPIATGRAVAAVAGNGMRIIDRLLLLLLLLLPQTRSSAAALLMTAAPAARSQPTDQSIPAVLLFSAR